MKCPRCGHWNKPTFPRCFQCGEPLPEEGAEKPSWREAFDAPRPDQKRAVYYDDDTPPESVQAAKVDAPPREETLAVEMNRLKERRARGSVYLEELRRNASEQGFAPSGAGVSIQRSGGFFGQVPDDPEETIYEPPEIRRQLRARSRARKERRPAEDDAFYPLEAEPSGASMDTEDLPPAYDDPLPLMPPAAKGRIKRRRYGAVAIAVWLVRGLTLFAAAFIIWQAVLLIQGTITPPSAADATTSYTIEEIQIDGLPGRRVRIAGEEGTQYYISELTKSYVVIGGIAEIEVADYVFYENIEHLDSAQMEATLTPTMIKGATEMRLSPISFTIDIPLSPVRLISPELDYIEVATSVYNLRLSVTPGSKVTVNGRDISDAVDTNGNVSDNPPIKAIGQNYVTVTVRAPYCRENNLTIIFYREPQEIPLEMSAATDTSSRSERFEINATTMSGATITIETPYADLDLASKDTTGEFKFVALMERVGYNTIRIRATYPGKKDSVLEHTVYYLPSSDAYTKKAWALKSSDYKELMANIAMRIRNTQIYKCQGTILEIIADKPQLAIMDTGVDGKEQLVLLQNESANEWEIGKAYRVYADVSGLYNEMPRMTGRFTYDPDPEWSGAN